MTLAFGFFVLSALGLAISVITFFRLRLPGVLIVPHFFFGWLAGVLALQTIVGQALVTIAFVWAGVLEAGIGRLGLALCLASWGLLALAHLRGVRAGDEFARALETLGLRAEGDISTFHGFPWPFSFAHPDVEVQRNLPYGESLEGDKGGRNLLDLARPKGAQSGDRRPVLLQVHGGAWMIGDKREQGWPLMSHLASRGWVCVAINYRLSPQATMPDHIVDVKRAIAWIRGHIAEYGGDPEFLCITGGSAGGHLSSLAAVTANDPAFQPGFEEVDTRLDGCVPFYGVYDFVDRAGDRGKMSMSETMGPRVFKSTPEEQPALWDAVSPITRVHADAPPFLVIQGSHDSLIFSEEAHTFVERLREKSEQPVLHAELLGAQHAFDIFHSPRSAHAVRAVTAFLEHLHAEYRKNARAA